jgi:transcription-repair coupling factor (superfamily II helicase)
LCAFVKNIMDDDNVVGILPPTLLGRVHRQRLHDRAAHYGLAVGLRTRRLPWVRPGSPDLSE